MKKIIIITFVFAFLYESYSQDLISGGSNSWIFHTPDNGSSTLHIAPQINGSWNWANEIEFTSTGIAKFGSKIGVGIGNNTPEGILEAKSSNGMRLILNKNNQSALSIIPNNSDAWFHLSHGLNNNLHISHGIQPGENKVMTIESNGNIGIGIDNPEAKLQIGWGLAFDDGGGAKQLGFNYNPTTNTDLGNTTYGTAIKTWNADGTLVFSTSPSVTSVPIDRMFLTKNGDVGIGIASPDEKLTVKGKIHTQEIIVDLNGAVAPDYVFEKDYNLKSLEEIEAYIKENKHLPEIPSAKTMEEEGVYLKKMNLLLLKKIEELTLHIIEQNKRIDKLEFEKK